MAVSNPFEQDTSIRSRTDDGDEPQATQMLRSKKKDISPALMKKVDAASVRVGWATDDEAKSFSTRSEPAILPSVQLGVRVAEPYLNFVKKVCSEKRQTKRVIVEEALDEYCKKHGYPPI